MSTYAVSFFKSSKQVLNEDIYMMSMNSDDIVDGFDM